MLVLNGKHCAQPKRMASGSFGEVFQVEEKETGETVVLKVMNVTAMPEELAMLKRLSEINSAQEKIPIVKILNFGVVPMSTLFPFLLQSRTPEERVDTLQNWIYLKGVWGGRKSSFSNAVVEVMERVHHTLAEWKNEDITDVMIFELYYSCLLLLQNDIEPDDIHPGNVGIYFAPTGVSYSMCDCTIILPRGSHILLFDWNNWVMQKQKQQKPLSHSRVWKWVKRALGTKEPSHSPLYNELDNVRNVNAKSVLWTLFHTQFGGCLNLKADVNRSRLKIVNRKFETEQSKEACLSR
jgi:hypothetical protein